MLLKVRFTFVRLLYELVAVRLCTQYRGFGCCKCITLLYKHA